MVRYDITVAGDRAATLEASRTKSNFFQTLKGVLGNLGTVSRLCLETLLVAKQYLGRIRADPDSTTAQQPRAIASFENRISNDLFCSSNTLS
ncbi:hypothetical protein EAE96_002490 [Botrytis aclada]|nr:hypothetical protein EAE96_002490 [Botrytis aclada]